MLLLDWHGVYNEPSRLFLEVQYLIKTKEIQKAPQLLVNDRLILEALRCTGGATRSELVERCDLPQTTVYDTLIRLERKGFVERYTEPRTIPGRPKIFFLLTVSAIRVFLIDKRSDVPSSRFLLNQLDNIQEI